LPSLAPEVTAAPKPNIVVFLSDDHGAADSSVYGAIDIPTPSMARLAADGMTFDQAFVVSPSCAPSRAALLTGLMPSRNGSEENHSRPQSSLKKLPAYLQDLGYEVVSFGKTGHYAQTPEYGFDLAKHFNYHEDIAIPEALKWLEARTNDKPLCLFVGSNWPHVPWPEIDTRIAEPTQLPPKHLDTPETRSARHRYYSAVAKMDSELGQVYEFARRKLGEDTFFLHTSDHGAQLPFGKWNLYDTGTRTPFIAVWPNRISAGSRSQALINWTDILPTLVDVAGGQTDANWDGRSLLAVLIGKADKHRDAIFTVHSGDKNFNVFPCRAVRTNEWKLIWNLHPEYRYTSHITRNLDDGRYWESWKKKAESDPIAAETIQKYEARPEFELFDVKHDPDEKNNLAGDPKYAEKLDELCSQLTSWMDKQGDTRTTFGLPEILSQSFSKPNLVTIFIDDMGWSDLSCFGNKEVETKHIDRLAAEGIRFTQFYVNSPICSPSRTALMTGNFPAHYRITSFLNNRANNDERGVAQWLDVHTPTIGRMLIRQGYATGHFGKWHLGGQRDVGEAPLISEYGFEASLTNFEGLGPRVLPLNYTKKSKEGKPWDLGSAKLGRGPIDWKDRSIITGAFVDRALEFIDASQKAGKPFFFNLWPDDVHSPFHPPLSERTSEGKRELYLSVLKAMDAQLAPLLDRIRNDSKLRDNTLIVFASDNGPEPGAGQSGSLRGSKGYLWEGGIRSPLIVWGPGLIEPSAVGSTNSKTIVSSVDIVASLKSLADAPSPDGYRPDGENLLPVLLGKTHAQRSKPLFWRRPPDRPGTDEDVAPDLAVRDGAWKLLCQTDGSQVHLYDIVNDPSETKNLAKKNPKVAERLKRLVLGWNSELPIDGVK
jgi:uncharacterized sulfatase